MDALEKVTADAEAACALGNATRVNLRMCCSEMRSYIELSSLGVIAVITLKAIEDSYTHGKEAVTVHDLSALIGARLEAQVYIDWVTQQDANIGELARKSASMPGSTPKYRLKRTKLQSKKSLKAKGVTQPDEWSYPHKCRIGEYLLEVAQLAQYAAGATFERVRKYKTPSN